MLAKSLPFPLWIIFVIPGGALQYLTKWKQMARGFIQPHSLQVMRLRRDSFLDLFSSSAVKMENHAVEVRHYRHVSRTKREPTYTLIDFVEAESMQLRIVSTLNLAPGCLDNRWLNSMGLPLSESCSNFKCRACNSKKSTLDNMREHWRISINLHDVFSEWFQVVQQEAPPPQGSNETVRPFTN